MIDDGTNEDIPPGFKLRHTLRAHEGAIIGLAWSPEGHMLASASEDSKIRLWDLKTGILRQILHEHSGEVTSVAWSPDGHILASGSADHTIRLWDVALGKTQCILEGHSDCVRSLAWSPDGKILASGSYDHTVRFWHQEGKKSCQILKGHADWVYSVVWSPDGQLLASSSRDNTIQIYHKTGEFHSSLKTADSGEWISGKTAHWIFSVAWSPNGENLAAGTAQHTICLWNAKSGYQANIIEESIGWMTSVSFSAGGHLLASKSSGDKIHIFRCDNWDKVGSFIEPYINGYWALDLAFHPKAPILATLGEFDTAIRIWDIDLDVLLGIPPVTRTVHYTNAKAVLVGDSGVGKSGLGMVLSGQPFAPTESTHGRRVWTFDSHQAWIDERREETRETLLWDLAGQPGYRLIHQLHLGEVALALVVFDARSETDPFGGVYHWDRALRQARLTQGQAASPLKKLLVAARTDRGGIPVSRERIAALVRDLGFNGYFETSAKEGWGIAELAEAIRTVVDWDTLPKISSTELFQQIKHFLIVEKETGRLLSSADDLYRAFLRLADAPAETKELRAQFETCIGRVESRGLIRRLSFGGLVLLQPELLDAYASALIIAARDEPDGLGCIAEERARAGRFPIPHDERIADKAQETLLLIATVEDLLGYEIALREPADDGAYLIFPSQLTRERPDLPDPEGKALVFSFEGPVLNVYATLAVRLSHSGLFSKQELWKNAATYAARVGGICGIFLREIEEGRGELTLFFDAAASEETRFQFEEYIQVHLLRRALPGSIVRRRVFACPACGEPITDRQAQRRRELGHTLINCPVCDTRISLLDREERLVASRPSRVPEMDRAADARRDLATAESVLQGKLETSDSDIHTWKLIVIKRRRLHELEKQHAYHGVSTPPQIILEIEDLRREIAEREGGLKDSATHGR